MYLLGVVRDKVTWLRSYSVIPLVWRDKHLVCIFKSTLFDPIHPYNKVSIKCPACFWCRAHKVCNHGRAVPRGYVTKNAHTTGLLYAVFFAKAKVFVDLSAYFISIEVNATKLTSKLLGQCCFA